VTVPLPYMEILYYIIHVEGGKARDMGLCEILYSA